MSDPKTAFLNPCRLVGGLDPKSLRRVVLAVHCTGRRSVILWWKAKGSIEILYAASRLPARAPPSLPGGPAPATAPYVLLEGHSTHHPVLPSDGDLFRRRPPLSRRGLRLLRTRRRCGFQIFADTSIRLQHIGIYGYSWEDVGGGLPRYPSYRLRMSDGDEPADA